MDKYNKIQPFEFDKNRYLFFDIFARNNELVIVCPIYSQDYVNFENITAKVDDKYLPIKTTKISYVEAAIAIVIFELNIKDENFQVLIEYNSIIKSFDLLHLNCEKQYFLTQTTLFKDDYYLIRPFYNYYKNQGVEHFYLYYNGFDNILPSNIYNNDDITLLSWPFKYCNDKSCKFVRHAQIGQMHHAFYKYGKPMSEFMIFNDLDEYMYIPHKTIIELIKKNISKISFVFLNNWADSSIPKEYIDQQILKDKSVDRFPVRCKCIHNTLKLDLLNIHTSKHYSSTTMLINESNLLLHFYKWSGKNRNKLIFDGESFLLNRSEKKNLEN
jgi:hypothetical protein